VGKRGHSLGDLVASRRRRGENRKRGQMKIKIW
jgi:hypothetical protein